MPSHLVYEPTEQTGTALVEYKRELVVQGMAAAPTQHWQLLLDQRTALTRTSSIGSSMLRQVRQVSSTLK